MHIPILLLALLLVTVTPAASAEKYGNIYNVEYLRNRSAETIVVNIAGVHPLIGREIEVQLRGLELPALAGRCRRETELAGQARDIVQQLLSRARTIVLQDVGRGRSFRIEATVLADDLDIRQVLIARGLAHRGGNGPPPNWCQE
jgi:hypothetical protein